MSVAVAEGRVQVRQMYRLLQCVYQRDTELIEKMMNLGVENLINLTEPEDGRGVLHAAVVASNPEMVSYLLSKGVNPDIQDKTGRTAVMLAAEMGSDAIVELLAQSSASFSIRDTEGKGVLFYCLYPTKSHNRCLQVALKSQADVNNVSAEGTHIFQLMCRNAQQYAPMCLMMLDEGTDPNASDQRTGVTALMRAAEGGSLQLVRAILKKGGDPNARDRKGSAVVHYAAMGGSWEVIRALSAYSAIMDVTNRDKCNPLHFAAATGEANCCKFLVQRGCNTKVKNQEGLLPQQIAKDAGHKAAAKELRKKTNKRGKDKESVNISLMSDLWTLTLHDWCHENENELRQAFGSKLDAVPTESLISVVLEELKAPVRRNQLQTIISVLDNENQGCVSITDFIKGVKYIKKPFLLSSYMPKKKKGEKGAKGGKKKGQFVLPMPICTLPSELMLRRPDGGPPHFMIETYSNSSDVCRFDRDHPPEHPIMNDSGWYVDNPEKVYVNINYCVKSGDLESIDLALTQGVPVDVKDQFYKTPLMVACSSGSYEVAQYLLSRGADVNACDQFLWTPLHHAAHAGQVQLIKLLIEAGATIDARALNGGTPLMRAIESSRPSCVDLLIKAGASVEAERKDQDCLVIAKAFGDSRIIDLVKDKMHSLPKPKENTKGKGVKAQKTKPAKVKSAAAGDAVHAETSTATTGKTPPRKDSKSIILQNARITTAKANTVDITFVPKTVWGKPPTTSQLMSKIEKRRELLSLELDFDDFMTPFNQNIQSKALDLS